MEKIIFLSLAIPILGFVLYLGGTAIMNGFKAKADNKSKETTENETEDILSNNDQNKIKTIKPFFFNLMKIMLNRIRIFCCTWLNICTKNI